MFKKDSLSYVFITSEEFARTKDYYVNVIQLAKDAESGENFASYTPKAFAQATNNENTGKMFMSLHNDDKAFMKLRAGLDISKMVICGDTERYDSETNSCIACE